MNAIKKTLLLLLSGFAMLISGCHEDGQDSKASFEWEPIIEGSQLDNWSRKGEVDIKNENGVLTLSSQ